MPAIKQNTSTGFRALFALVLVVPCLAAPVDEEAPKTNAPVFKVEARLDNGPGQLPAYRVYSSLGSNRYAFLLPGGFRMQGLEGRTVKLVMEDSSCIISFTVTPAKTWDVPE